MIDIAKKESLADTATEKFKFKEVLTVPVIVASLGYFVDVYDLLLFQIVRKKSLIDIGISSDALDDKGLLLLNIQMIGLLVGGIVWGILADKKGRLAVLFGSIFTYSIANFLNGFVTNIEQYAILRFVAGFGLAGELGAGITLVMEVMKKETRGIGAMMVASTGVLGAVVGVLVSLVFSWKVCYFIGGGMGLALLIMRISVFESGMYSKMKESTASKGNMLMLFTSFKRFSKYIQCIVIGMPVWFIIGILITFSSTFASPKFLNVNGRIDDEFSIMFCYMGLVLGDLLSGSISQVLRSRKKAFAIFFAACIAFVTIYMNLGGTTPFIFYTICFLLGVSVGYWAIFVTNAAEQFGTNIRGTVTTTVPNFVRGSLVPISILYVFLKKVFVIHKPGQEPYQDIIMAASVTGIVVMLISITALYFMEEPFGKDLDYIEE